MTKIAKLAARKERKVDYQVRRKFSRWVTKFFTRILGEEQAMEFRAQADMARQVRVNAVAKFLKQIEDMYAKAQAKVTVPSLDERGSDEQAIEQYYAAMANYQAAIDARRNTINLAQAYLMLEPIDCVTPKPEHPAVEWVILKNELATDLQKAVEEFQAAKDHVLKGLCQEEVKTLATALREHLATF